MIGEIINVILFVGKEVIKDEVLKCIVFVVLVYIVMYGSVEIGDICLVLNFLRKYWKLEKEDYMLKMLDIKVLKFWVRFVVFSFCYSGWGDVFVEGVVGMVWVFLVFGVCFVLVLFWVIGDEVIMEFMKIFYKYFRDGNNVSMVFYKVMKCLREFEEFSVLKNWVLFVIIGDDVMFEFEEDIE